MKYEILQNSSWHFRNWSFSGFSIAALTLFIFLWEPLPTFSQHAKKPSGVDRVQIKYRLNRQQFNQLLPFIGEQTSGLQKIYTKYSDRPDVDYFPFWLNGSVWADLEGNRQIFGRSFRSKLSKGQLGALGATFLSLEKETLRLLTSEQVPVWCDQLDLTDQQCDDVQKIIERDLSRKLSILNKRSPDKVLSGPLLKAISIDTEKRVWGCFFQNSVEFIKRINKKPQMTAIGYRDSFR